MVEIFTLQSLPDPPRASAGGGVRSLVAPGGSLLLIAFRHDGSSPADAGPPFPLTEDYVTGMASDGLTLVELERLDGPRWRVSYRG